MTLLEYMEQLPEDDFVIPAVTVHDADYDVEVYFWADAPEDEWDRSMRRIASQLTVIEEIAWNEVTVNLSRVIERCCSKMGKLFFNTDIDAVMDCIEGVLAGSVSESWLSQFADILCGKEI